MGTINYIGDLLKCNKKIHGFVYVLALCKKKMHYF